MSILSAATTQPDEIAPGGAAFGLALLAWGLLAAHLLGVFRARSVSGPVRLAPATGVAGVFMLLAVTVFAWLGTQVVYFSMIRHRLPTNAQGGIDVSMFAPSDMAFLGTVPALVGLAVMMTGGRLVNPALPRELGWTFDRLFGGVWRGLLAMVCVMPLMFGAMIVLQLLYQAIGYQHPTEHEMLTVLGKTQDPVTKFVIVGGATLLVPVFEEFLFRGHLQTVLVRLFTSNAPGPLPAQGFPVVQHHPAAPDGVLAAPVMEAAPALQAPREASPAGKWAAIGIASLAFTVMHPGWTWPLIFLLSLALGYAYERTGNLWVPAVMHLVFNTFNTALFLYTRML